MSKDLSGKNEKGGLPAKEMLEDSFLDAVNGGVGLLENLNDVFLGRSSNDTTKVAEGNTTAAGQKS